MDRKSLARRLGALIVAAVVLLFLLLLLVAHMVRQRKHRSRASNRHYAARSSRHNRYR